MMEEGNAMMDEAMDTTVQNEGGDGEMDGNMEKTSQGNECEVHHVDGAKELEWIRKDEKAHITWRRMLFYFINFCFLFVA